MIQKPEFNKNVLVTGGTSGLGLELVKLFLMKGYNVVAMGRKQISMNGFEDRFKLYSLDFSNLGKVAETIRNICSNNSFGYVINNAGILSPPAYTETDNGLEYTFQINFLSHLLIDRIIVNSSKTDSLRIASVSSPVYRYAGISNIITTGSGDYSPVRAYSSSKLYLAMMHEFLAARNSKVNLHCFSFDPGTFSSSIYRMQKRWFRNMYMIAAPFMRSPVSVATALVEIMLDKETEDGMMYDIYKRYRSIPEMDKSKNEALISSCYKLIENYLD
jgi:NAD(P)-dependent dehydrogenase (short-subunit alcohol dehydrogenase family)